MYVQKGSCITGTQLTAFVALLYITPSGTVFEYKPGSKFPITPLDRLMEWEIVTSEGMKFKALQLFTLVSRKVKPVHTITRRGETVRFIMFIQHYGCKVVAMQWGMHCALVSGGAQLKRYFMSPLECFVCETAPCPSPTGLSCGGLFDQLG